MTRLSDCDQFLAKRLITAIDVASQNCFYRRRFVLQAQELGLEIAYQNWRANAPIVNPPFRDLADSIVGRLREKIHSTP